MADDADFDANSDTGGDQQDDNENRSTGITNPRDTDVLCGRGGAALRHPGNQTYRRLVNLNKGLYTTCLKTEKLKISRSIVAAIREQNGRFLEKDNSGDSDGKGTWYDIGDKKAIEKTSQALREGQPKLRQKIAEMGTNNGGVGLPIDINPHSLGPNSNSVFPNGSIHSVHSGASFSIDGSALLSTADVASIQSSSYNHNHHNNRNEIMLASSNGGGLGMAPPLPPFLQQKQQMGGTGNGLGMGFQNIDSGNNAALEFQVQRMQQQQGNPHHRDIQINNCMSASPNRNLAGQDSSSLIQSELLQSLHELSVASGTNPNNNSMHANSLSAMGMSIRTVESNAINTINTFNTMNTSYSNNDHNFSNNNNGAAMSSNFPMDNFQQRLALARGLGIDESQLSLLTDFSQSNNNTNHTNTNGGGGFMQTSSVNGGGADMASIDSFKRALNKIPLMEPMNNGMINNILNGNNGNNMNLGHGDNDNNHHIHQHQRHQMLNLNTNHSRNNPQISHIHLAVDQNQSLTSCVTNHSAFNNMEMSSLHSGMMGAPSFSSGRTNNNAGYQQLLQQQQQQQNLLFLQQQQQQQRQAGNRSNTDNLIGMNSLNYNNHNNASLMTVASSGGILSTGANTTNNNINNINSNQFDRRRIFAKMKYVRPPSIRENPEPTSVSSNHPGSNRSHPHQQRRTTQPEVTKIKISDGVSGRSKANTNVPSTTYTQQNSTANASASSVTDMQDLSICESVHTLSSSQFMSPTADDHEQSNNNDTRHKNNINSKGTNNNSVVVEIAKVIDHSTNNSNNADNRMNANQDPLGSSRHSAMSGLSMTSIISDLSKKIGNVSTRSMAMSEMSSVDNLDMDEHDDEDEDGSGSVGNEDDDDEGVRFDHNGNINMNRNDGSTGSGGGRELLRMNLAIMRTGVGGEVAQH